MPVHERDALKRAVLDTIVPYDTISSITDILDEPEEDVHPDRPSLLHVKQRTLLFFGRLLVPQFPSINLVLMQFANRRKVDGTCCTSAANFTRRLLEGPPCKA